MACPKSYSYSGHRLTKAFFSCSQNFLIRGALSNPTRRKLTVLKRARSEKSPVTCSSWEVCKKPVWIKPCQLCRFEIFVIFTQMAHRTMRTLSSSNSSGLFALRHILKNLKKYTIEHIFFLVQTTWRKIEKIRFSWISPSKLSNFVQNLHSAIYRVIIMTRYS